MPAKFVVVVGGNRGGIRLHVAAILSLLLRLAMLHKELIEAQVGVSFGFSLRDKYTSY